MCVGFQPLQAVEGDPEGVAAVSRRREIMSERAELLECAASRIVW